MQESWIPIQCPDCNERWQESPSDLPHPDGTFVCTHCDVERTVAEFIQTEQGLEILRNFHA